MKFIQILPAPDGIYQEFKNDDGTKFTDKVLFVLFYNHEEWKDDIDTGSFNVKTITLTDINEGYFDPLSPSNFIGHTTTPIE